MKKALLRIDPVKFTQDTLLFHIKMLRLLIARHGNTFEPGEIPLRVGCKTDKALSAGGRIQAQRLGLFLKQHYSQLSAVYSSCLARCYDTAHIALQVAGLPLAVKTLSIFNEIDYGVDEGKTEDRVIARIGEQALKSWNDDAIAPPGWQVDPKKIILNWQLFAKEMLSKQGNEGIILVVTSNGIARFAVQLLKNVAAFKRQYPLKIATGAICCLNYKADWEVEYWNVKPQGMSVKNAFVK